MNQNLFDRSDSKPEVVEIDPDNPITKRVNRAIDIFSFNKIEKIADFGKNKIYLVESQTDSKETHVVMTGDEVKCSCPDHFWRGIFCKHAYAVIMLEQSWSLKNKEMEIAV